MRKIIHKGISAVLMLLLFMGMSGCSQPTQPAKVNPVKTPLNFRITWKDYSDRGVAIKKIVDRYNEQSTGSFEVVLQGGDEDLETIKTAINAGEDAPILVLPYRYVKYFGSEMNLKDLSEDFATEKNYFYPKLWQLGTVDEKAYGIPWVGHSICLIYNKNLLDTAGVKPEGINSLEAFEKALIQVEEKTEAKGLGLVGANHNDVSWMVNQFVYGFGSQLVDSSGKKVAINNERTKEALEFYLNHLGKYAQSTWKEDTGVEVMAAFRDQSVAFEFQGPWGLTDIEKNGNPFEVGTINLEKIGLKSEVGPMMLAIPKNLSAEKQGEAVNFIKFMISPEAQEKIMDGEYSPEHDAYYPFRVPTRMDLTKELVFKKYPEYEPFLEGFKDPSIDVPVPKWQTVKDEVYAPNLHKVMLGEMSIEAFLKKVETEGNQILNSGK